MVGGGGGSRTVTRARSGSPAAATIAELASRMRGSSPDATWISARRSSSPSAAATSGAYLGCMVFGCMRC
jgi:hypothetical protein